MYVPTYNLYLWVNHFGLHRTCAIVLIIHRILFSCVACTGRVVIVKAKNTLWGNWDDILKHKRNLYDVHFNPLTDSIKQHPYCQSMAQGQSMLGHSSHTGWGIGVQGKAGYGP